MRNKKIKVGIIHYGCGNIYNIKKSLYKIGLENVDIIETGSLNAYDILILPGVGSFKNAMDHIVSSGYKQEIANHIKEGKKILGICLGMQLFMESSEELEETKGLGIIKGKVEHLNNSIPSAVLPHVGLNRVVCDGILNDCFYFDHSYKVVLDDNILEGKTIYSGDEFISFIKKDNIVGVQFHPELSGETGLKFLSDFFC